MLPDLPFHPEHLFMALYTFTSATVFTRTTTTLSHGKHLNLIFLSKVSLTRPLVHFFLNDIDYFIVRLP